MLRSAGLFVADLADKIALYLALSGYATLQRIFVIPNSAPQSAWPSLPEPFGTALRHAVEFIRREFEPVGVIATGTIVRGTAHKSSDLDLCVVHRAPHRRRIQRYFDGVPAEIFINPPSAIRAYFAEEDQDGRRL